MSKPAVSLWRRLGLRGRLFAAFGVVAATTLLASGNALISYDRLGRSLDAVTATSMAHMARAADVAKAVDGVASAAQTLRAARTEAERTHAQEAANMARAQLM